MLPLDSDVLMFIKFFVVFTCIFFWIKLGYDVLMRHHHIHRRHHRD